jgi:hypothetical protein
MTSISSSPISLLSRCVGILIAYPAMKIKSRLSHVCGILQYHSRDNSCSPDSSVPENFRSLLTLKSAFGVGKKISCLDCVTKI